MELSYESDQDYYHFHLSSFKIFSFQGEISINVSKKRKHYTLNYTCSIKIIITSIFLLKRNLLFLKQIGYQFSSRTFHVLLGHLASLHKLIRLDESELNADLALSIPYDHCVFAP